METTVLIILGGLGVGLLYGLFGVGSAFATPVLSLLGVPGMAAIVGHLPALFPGSAAGAWSYSKQGKVDWAMPRAALIGAFPAAIVGASLANRLRPSRSQVTGCETANFGYPRGYV